MAKLGDPTDFSYRVNKVTKVVDGDTIDVIIDLGFDIMYKSRVRLFGIDTPESRTRDKVEKKYGLLSKAYLKEQLKSGKIVIKTHKDRETGKFGRILGAFYIFDGEQDRQVLLAEYMIKHYVGVAYDGKSKEEIYALHIRNRNYLIAEGYLEA